MNNRLFSLGPIDVTPVMLICVGLVIVLVIAVVAFRKNYILQVNLSQLMDPESGIHNAPGTIVVLKKRRKKLRKVSRDNPQSLVVIRIDNLGTLYVGYKERTKLMRAIVQVMRYDLHDKEFITRLDFDKFCIAMTNRDRAEIKEYVLHLNEQLDEMEIEQYGLYSFFLTAAVYLGAPLEYPRQDLELTIATLSYATLKDDNIYFYNDDVLAKVKLIEAMNLSKEAALESNQFVPYVMPKVDFSTGKVVGGELLVRWMNGDQEVLYYPDEFIPLFESNGFIKRIDILMFEKACTLYQMCANYGHPEVIIGSNFSSLTLNSLKSIDAMIEIAHQYGVNPGNIEIEILEAQFLRSLNNFDRSLQRLKQAGFRVALDAFGKESSSLYLLSNNKFDTIKLDKLFFNSNLTTDKDKHVVKNLINLLTKIGSGVILEGIESKQSLDYIATVSRNVVLEGYYFTKPVPFNDFLPFLDRLYEFDYPEIQIDDGKNKIEISGVDKDTVDATVQTGPNGGTSINISGLGGTTVQQNNDKELEEMRRQMDEMRHRFELSLEEQRRLAHEEEMKRMQAEMERLKNKPAEQKDNSAQIDALRLEIERLRIQSNQPQPQPQQTIIKDYRDDEIYRLQREIDDLRYDRRGRDHYVDRDRYVVTDRYVSLSDRDRDHEHLQRQIDELRNRNQQPITVQAQQPAINIDLLIEKLSKTQNEQARLAAERTAEQFNNIRDMLEQERKEREDLESLLMDLKNNSIKEESEVVDEEEQIKEQEEADKNLNLDLSSLSRTDSDDDDDDSDDDDDDEDDDEKLEKPKLTLEELEAIIESYRDKYDDDWNQHAKEELQVGYYEVINGLKYYQKHAKRTFADKIRNASPELKQLYNIVKNEIMKYKGISNRVTNSYDCFYCGRKQVVKLSLSKKKVKVFLAADPAAYPEKSFPHKDVSAKKSHVRTPYYTMVKSQLSVKRMNKVIADIMKSNGYATDPNYKPVDYATKFKFMKNDN